MRQRGLFGKLSGIFFEEHSAPQADGQESPTGESRPVTLTATAAQQPRASVGNIHEMKVQVRAQLDEEHPPAFEAFDKLMKSLATAVPEESQRIKTVLTVLSGQGMTPDMVLRAFEDRVTEVNEYAEGFAQRIQVEKEDKLGSLENRRLGIAGQIEEIESKIRDLQESLKDLRTERDATDVNISAERERIDLLDRQMEAVLSDIRSELKTEWDIVAAHITGRDKEAKNG